MLQAVARRVGQGTVQLGGEQEALWLGSTRGNTANTEPIESMLMCKSLRKEGNVLFNDALNIFYLRLYGVRHMVKDHSDSEKGNP